MDNKNLSHTIQRGRYQDEENIDCSGYAERFY